MGTVVRCEQVSRSFGSATAAVDVSFDVHAGEVFSLLGHNGAGKTTLLRLINGLLTPDDGRIETLGLDPVADGHLVRQRTGVLTTYPGLDDYLSPAENLAVYGAIHGIEDRVLHHRITSLLDQLGLDPRSNEPSRGLSAGLKQRVALARALIHDPELLLLDEPTANLDPIAARDVRAMVRDLANEGRTVIFCSHNLAEAEQLSDRVAILQSGHLVAVGSLDDLAQDRLRTGVDLVVGPHQAPEALAAIRSLLNGQGVSTPRHDRIHVEDLSAGAVADLVRALVAAEVDVFSATPTTPSLEDVYLAVHRSRTAP